MARTGGGKGETAGEHVFLCYNFKNTYVSRLVEDTLCAYVIGLRVSYYQNDETLGRNSRRYLSKAN